MNPEQIRVITENINEIRQGISNKRTKELGIRQFCIRRVRKINERKVSLYVLTDEWNTYIESEIQKMKTSSQSRTNPGSPLKHISYAEPTLTTSDSDSHAKEIEELFNELPNSSSSFINESSCRDMSRDVYRSFIKGDSVNMFVRAVIVRHYLPSLSEEGLSSNEIIENGLYEILVNHLVRTVDGLYKLYDESIFHYEYCIYKFFNEGIQKYIDLIPKECFQCGDIIDFIRTHGISSDDIEKYVQIIIDFIIFDKKTTDAKMIFKFIPIISKKTIQQLMQRL